MPVTDADLSNCLQGVARYYDWAGWTDSTNDLSNRWGAAVAYHVGMKWIWLNAGHRHHSTATLEMVTVSDVIFADEAFIVDRQTDPLP